MDIDLLPEERWEFEERSAIKQYLANMPRWKAEREALAEIHKQREKSNVEQSNQH